MSRYTSCMYSELDIYLINNKTHSYAIFLSQRYISKSRPRQEFIMVKANHRQKTLYVIILLIRLLLHPFNSKYGVVHIDEVLTNTNCL